MMERMSGGGVHLGEQGMGGDRGRENMERSYILKGRNVERVQRRAEEEKKRVGVFISQYGKGVEWKNEFYNYEG